MRRIFAFVHVRLVVEGAVTALTFAIAMLVQDLHDTGRLPLATGIGSQVLVTLALCGAVAGAYVMVVRWVEDRWAEEARPEPRAIALGVIVGFTLCCSVYLVFALIGIATWVGVSGGAALPAALAAALLPAVGEEMVFRGVLFRLLEDGLGTTAALILTAVLFGAMHAGNPGASYLSTVAVGLEAGVLLASAYVWSRSLWLVIGLHFAWNFTEGGIFGAPVSGSPTRGLLVVNVSRTAPDQLSGGAFGPEASLVAVALCLVAATIFAVPAARAGRWQPWRFRLRQD